MAPKRGTFYDINYAEAIVINFSYLEHRYVLSLSFPHSSVLFMDEHYSIVTLLMFIHKKNT